MSNFLTTFQAAERLGVSVSRIHALLYAGRIEGAEKIGARRGTWIIPANADGLPVVTPHPERPRKFAVMPAAQ